MGLEAEQSDSSVSNNTNLPASSQSAAGTVPRLIKFTGEINPQIIQITRIKESEGGKNQLPTAVDVTFSLYELQEGGSPLWSELQKVQVDEQGHYTVLLGATQPGGLPLDLFTTGKALWVGVQAQLPGQAEQPRVLLVAVPYSLKSSDADTLGGLPASAYALAGSQTVVALAGGAALSSAPPTTAQPGSQAVAAVSSASPQQVTTCTAVTSDGTATANTVAKFTSACNVENSLIWDNGTGVAVGGTSTPGALLDVQYTSTATSGGPLLGQRVLATLNPAATSSASVYGAFSDTTTAGGNTQNFTGSLYGDFFRVDHSGTGTVAYGVGTYGGVVNRAAGTITNATGVQAVLWNASTGTITNGYGMYVGAANSGGGTFSNFYGLYVADSTAAVPGAYGLYSAGGKNYFGGNVGIGTTTPVANLEVNGTAKFDGLMTFASGQTFPGTGTVTSVASGPGLTGGPIITTGIISATAASLVRSCSISLGDGVNPIPAGTYPVSFQCKNDTGATITVTGIQCATNNAGATTCDVATNAPSNLLTGPITSSTGKWVAGTQSSTTTITSGQWLTATFVADGTSTIISLDVAGTL
jgi:hypothetical protein